MDTFITNMTEEAMKNSQYNSHNHVAFLGKICKKAYLLRNQQYRKHNWL